MSEYDLYQQLREIQQQVKELAGWVGRYPVRYSTANVSNPPTDAELDAEFGTPAAVGAGFMSLVNDSGTGSYCYLITSDGTDWWYTQETKAT